MTAQNTLIMADDRKLRIELSARKSAKDIAARCAPPHFAMEAVALASQLA